MKCCFSIEILFLVCILALLFSECQDEYNEFELCGQKFNSALVSTWVIAFGYILQAITATNASSFCECDDDCDCCCCNPCKK